jgi:cytochrome c biogenesis protein CcmG, thiol:disulfide interchange protein DsbE
VEAPQLQQLHRKYFDRGLRLVGVTQMDPTPAEIRAFLQQYGITYPVVLDPGEKTGGRYRLEGHPTGVLIDRKGIVRFVHTGFLKGDEKLLDQAIQAVLAGHEPPKGDG